MSTRSLTRIYVAFARGKEVEAMLGRLAVQWQKRIDSGASGTPAQRLSMLEAALSHAFIRGAQSVDPEFNAAPRVDKASVGIDAIAALEEAAADLRSTPTLIEELRELVKQHAEEEVGWTQMHNEQIRINGELKARVAELESRSENPLIANEKAVDRIAERLWAKLESPDCSIRKDYKAAIEAALTHAFVKGAQSVDPEFQPERRTDYPRSDRLSRSQIKAFVLERLKVEIRGEDAEALRDFFDRSNQQFEVGQHVHINNGGGRAQVKRGPCYVVQLSGSNAHSTEDAKNLRPLDAPCSANPTSKETP